MAEAEEIEASEKLDNCDHRIYAYTNPDEPLLKGYAKITDAYEDGLKNELEETAVPNICAKDFRSYLIKELGCETPKDWPAEWIKIDPKDAKELLDEFNSLCPFCVKKRAKII